MIHTTIGLYNDGRYKINGVKPEHLEEHIEHNKKMRFGRALFVDGKCVYKGYLTDKKITSMLNAIAHNTKQFTRTTCTVPYH